MMKADEERKPDAVRIKTGVKHEKLLKLPDELSKYLPPPELSLHLHL